MISIPDHCLRVRPLPVALAHRLARARPGDPAMTTFNRLYASLSVADQVRCRAELQECRAAIRGHRPASVA